MAHELSLFDLNGKTTAEMAYRGEKPWHGLGQEVQSGAPIETWLREARMEWKYQNATVNFRPASDAEEIKSFPKNEVIYRSDTLEPLSVVSNRYQVVQPKTMIEFFRSLVEQEGFEIETIGSMKGGRRIWAMAKTNIEEEVREGDRIKANLLLMTSCDGSLATTAKFVTTRVVCWNTQQVALNESGESFKVRHNTAFDATALKGRMGLIGRQAFGNFMTKMTTLSQSPMSALQAGDIVASLISSTKEDPRKSNGYTTIMNLFNGAQKGYELPGVAGTAWGLLNAVTEYTDHHMRSRNQENRLTSAWFGKGSEIKQAAEDVLLELVS